MNTKNIEMFYKKKMCHGIATVCITNQRDEIYTYGYANEKKNSVNEDTLFELASLSKAFTAMVIYRLYENGDLKLADRVCEYIAE